MHLRILPGLCDVPCHRFWAQKVANPAESGNHAIIKLDPDAGGSDNPTCRLCFSSGYHHEKVPSNPHRRQNRTDRHNDDSADAFRGCCLP